ncbi:MAG: nucleoid-associated protein [Zymomonas mobilis]|uniref:nucleoid-associated protein n=1 Tax=Zymomonas mobilis TaxID=542 RepID=UPI0039ECD36A
MKLENLVIKRMCLHEIYKRADDNSIVEPNYSSSLLQLDEKALKAFTGRVVKAFSSEAQCMKMSIRDQTEGSVSATGPQLLSIPDTQFPQYSQSWAELLSQAQTARNIPGGLVVVFEGHVLYPPTPFFAVMKAELHQGFLKKENLQASLVENLFLSPKTKLYKIGIFIKKYTESTSVSNIWDAFVYDSHLTESNRDGAASYFYDKFLGLDVPTNSARQTRFFFTSTTDFIKNLKISEDEKFDLYNCLYSYLKTEKSPTIQVCIFANRFMSPDLGDSYIQYMREHDISESAIIKDLSELKSKLQRRRIKFSHQITLSGTPENVHKFVKVNSIRNEEEGKSWTQIMIQGSVEGQE